MDPHRQQRTDDEGRRVEGERLARTDAEHEQRGDRGPDEERQVRHRLGDRLGVLEQGRGHGLGNEAGVRGLKERLRAAEQDLDHDEFPDRQRPREDERSKQRMQCRARQVGGDDDPLPRQTVSPHSAEEQQGDERERLRAEDESEVRR